MSKLADLTGQKFGRLTVIERAENIGDRTRWKCQCDCGNEIIVYATNLKRGLTKSCGCYGKNFPSHLKHGHGKHGDSTYNVYTLMKSRCYNTNNKAYKNYGGRGIAVCDEWLHDFKAFYDYVSVLPHFGEAGYSLDRINNDGNYEPNNVRWATKKEQANNRRTSKNI